MRKSAVLMAIVVVAIVFALLFVAVPSPVAAQSVSLDITKIEKTDKGFVLKGTVTGSDLYPEGQRSVRNTVYIIADVEEGINSVYPKLPKGWYVRLPAGAETPYTEGSGPGGTMTNDEYKGVSITSVSIASFGLGETPVEFEGIIPLEYANKTLRIRARLDHMWSGTWPAMTFDHDIDYEGQLTAAVGPTPTLDSDKDGVPDDKDKCSDTPAGTEVDEKGCPCPKGGQFTWSTIGPDSSFIIEPDTDLKYSHPPVDILGVDVIGGSETTYEKYTEMLKAGVAPKEVRRVMDEDKILALAMESGMYVFEDYFLWVCVKGLEGAAWAGRRANFILGCGTGATGTFSSVLDAFYAYADRRIQAVDDGKSLDEAHELGISAAGRKAFENIAGTGFSKYKHFGKYKQRLFNTVKQTCDWNLFDPVNVGQVKVNIPSSDISERSVPRYVRGYQNLPPYFYQPVGRPPQ